MSIFLHVLIALECSYALIWPLRHRVVSTKVYIYCVIFTWVAGISESVIYIFANCTRNLVFGILIVKYCFIVRLCLVSICASYIWQPEQDFTAEFQLSIRLITYKMDLQLSFVRTASLVCRRPSVVVYCAYVQCSKCCVCNFGLRFGSCSTS